MMKNFLTLFLLIIPICLKSQYIDQANNSLRVQGIYITKEKPEIIELAVFIRNKSRDFKTCSDSLTIVLQEVTEIFTKNKIEKEKIKISEISVDENIDYYSGERKKEGFVGVLKIEVQDEFSKTFIEKIFNSLASITFDLTYNVKFSLSESQKEKLRKLAIEKANDDALEKAHNIASINNLELIKINRISYESEFSFGIQNSGYDLVEGFLYEEMPITRRATDFENSKLSINPKEVSIVKTVNMEWSIKEKKY